MGGGLLPGLAIGANLLSFCLPARGLFGREAPFDCRPAFDPCERVKAKVMRITLERSNLLKSLNHVHRVVERRNTIPILSNVLLKAEGNDLEMKATDLDLEITEKTPADTGRKHDCLHF